MSLLRSNLAVAGGTVLSRLTGVARLAVLGVVLGQSALADAYDGANNSPNQVYELLLGGVLSASLVPVFTRLLDDDDDNATGAIIGSMITLLFVLTTVAVLAAPALFRLVSWRLDPSVDADQFRSTGTALSRIFLIQIFFYGLMAVLSALLNARRHFFAAAVTPALANIVTIAALWKVHQLFGGREPSLALAQAEPTILRWLGFGATGGIAIMALALLPSTVKNGIRLTLLPNFRHPAVKRVLTLSGWSLGFAAANIVSSIIVRNLAEYGSGGPDAYSKAYAFFTLPHGLLAVSIATTFIPDLTRFVKARDRHGFVERLSLGLRLVSCLTVPASIGLFVLRRPLIGGVFQYLNFDAAAADRTADALGGLSVGLFGYSLYLLALRGFHAHTDMRTPFVLNLGQNVFNVVLAMLFVGRWGVMGLGLAFAASYIIAAAWALVVLSYKVRGFAIAPIAASLWRHVLAAALMGEVVWIATRLLGSDQGGGAIVRLLIAVPLGSAVYAVTLSLLGSTELSLISRRSPRPTA